MKILLLWLGVAASFLLALSFGAAEIPFKEVKRFLFFSLFHQGGAGTENTQTLILKEIRFPRIIAAGIVGMALAVSGACMQGMTRNPLAGPSLFGISGGAGAALAAALALRNTLNNYQILAVCLLGSFISAFVVFVLSFRGKHGLSNNKTILVGVAVSTILYALADALSLHFTQAKQMTLWASSGLIGVTLEESALVFPLVLTALIISLIYAKKLTLLSLDEELALNLGEHPGKLRVIFFILVTVLTGSAIALGGSLVFAGLVIPHLVRSFTGADYKKIIPCAIPAGAIFLILADLISRVINLPFETPLSSVMAVSSYPVFLYVVHKGKNSLES